MKKQRLYGLVLVLCGVISMLPTGDATAAMFFIPLGVAVILDGMDKKEGKKNGRQKDQ